MADLKAIVKNISANYLGTAVKSLVFLILTPILVHSLGEVSFGIWILANSVMFYLNFLDLGTYSAVVKYIAQYSAQNLHDQVNHLIGTALVTLLIAGFAALGLSILIALHFVTLLQVPPEHIRTLQIVIILLGIDHLVSFPGAVFGAVLEGYQRYDLLNLVGVIFHILRAASTILLLWLGFGLVALALYQIASSVARILVNTLIIRNACAKVRLSLRLFDRKMWKDTWRYSFWSFLNELATDGSLEIDRLLIPVFLSVSLVTPYSLACSLVALISWIVYPIVQVFFPLSSKYEAASDKKGLNDILLQGTKSVMAITIPVAIVIFFLGDSIISLWIGADSVDVDPLLVQILVVSFLASTLFWTSVMILMGLARLRQLFVFAVIELTIVIILASQSIERFQLIGLAASCAAGNIFVNFCCLLPFTCRSLRVPAWLFLTESLVKPLIPAIPAVFFAALLARYFQPFTWVSLVLAATTVFLVYGGSFPILSLSKTERGSIYQHARRLIASIH